MSGGARYGGYLSAGNVAKAWQGELSFQGGGEMERGCARYPWAGSRSADFLRTGTAAAHPLPHLHDIPLYNDSLWWGEELVHVNDA